MQTNKIKFLLTIIFIGLFTASSSSANLESIDNIDKTNLAYELSLKFDQNIDFGGFASFCVDYFNLYDVEPAENIFSDLTQTNSNYENILRLVKEGVIQGNGYGIVGPEDIITQNRAYIILSRIIKSTDEVDYNLTMAPYVTKEMCTPEYWINKTDNAYKLLMTPSEIKELNKKILLTPQTNTYDLENIEKKFDGKKLSEALANFESPKELYLDGKPVPEKYYEKIRKNIRNADVSKNMSVKYGFTINYTIMKAYPYEDFLSDDPEDLEWDNLVETSLYLNEPVVTYFTTKDKKYTYLKSHCCSGWVPTEDIAICKNKEEWQEAKKVENILVVTGEKVYLEASSDKPQLSEKLLSVGTVLELVGQDNIPAKVTNRSSWNNYVVKMPCRDEKGNFYQELAMIPQNRDVSIGYLPLTSASIVKQAFKSIGNRYGWGGMLKAQDCSSYVRDVYKCFGLELPRNTTWQAAMPVKVTDVSEMNEEQKLNYFYTLMPGTIFEFDGHEMIYIGITDDKIYTINNVSTLVNPLNEEGTASRIRNVIVNELSTKRRNQKTWLQEIRKAIISWEQE